MSERCGLLLINLGSPAEPERGSVARYLRQFLNDSRVIDINPLLRRLLVNLVIVPRRAGRSAALYRKIWLEDSSPLHYHTERLTAALKNELSADGGVIYEIKTAMRYGEPSIESRLQEFAREGIAQIKVVPLYPQYAAATTGSCLAELYLAAAKNWNVPSIKILPPFGDRPGFIRALTTSLNSARSKFETEAAAPIDYLLFSFHGLPERQVRKSDPTGGCLATSDCCDEPGQRREYCYPAQCYELAHAVAADLGLSGEEYGVAFQSRLGREPWLAPATDDTLATLPAQGKKRIMVCAPSFVADCLETLEELNIGGRESFLGAGGDFFGYVDCLNDNSEWVKELARLVVEL